MATFSYGPAEVFVVHYRGGLPDGHVLGALADLITTDTVRLLDLLLISRDAAGVVEVREIDDVTDRGAFGDVELVARGLTANEDVDEIADALAPGTSAAVVVLEHVWAKALAERFADTGGQLLWSGRVPAPELNELAAAAHIG